MPVGLREVLSEWKLTSPRTADSDPAFVARERHGEHPRQTERNVQARMKTALREANVALSAEGLPEIEGVTPHSLRRTYASIRAAAGDNPVYIAAQIGHKRSAFTMEEYSTAYRRRDRLSGARLAAYDQALAWSQMAEQVAETLPEPVPARAAVQEENGASPAVKLESGTVRL